MDNQIKTLRRLSQQCPQCGYFIQIKSTTDIHFRHNYSDLDNQPDEIAYCVCPKCYAHLKLNLNSGTIRYIKQRKQMYNSVTGKLSILFALLLIILYFIIFF